MQLWVAKIFQQPITSLTLADDHSEKEEGDRPELSVPFDERDFLQGKIPMLGGEAKPRELTGRAKIYPVINKEH